MDGENREWRHVRVIWTHNFSPSIENAGVFLWPQAEALRSLGVEVDLFYTGSLRSLAGIARARRRLLSIAKSYDVVHSQYGSACGLLTSVVDRPKVITLRGSDWHRYSGRNVALRLHSGLANRLTRLALPQYSAVVAVSDRIRREVVSSGHCSRVAVIPSPIDLRRFVPSSRAEARREMFSDQSRAPWVLFTTLNRTNPIKRASLALAVMERVRRVLPGVELKVASGVPHAKMPSFVSACDLVLCTSLYEGWPNSVKEGLACGLPFVSTNVSDLSDVALRHPPCFVGTSDPDVLAAAVLRALGTGGGAHLRSAVAGMTPEWSAAALLDVYRSVVD